MSREVEAIRIWGWVGYLWWEFSSYLEEGRTFRWCERCGELLVGTKRKRFCTVEENPECYRARRTADKQRERERKRDDSSII
jgi:hypothetical protein